VPLGPQPFVLRRAFYLQPWLLRSQAWKCQPKACGCGGSSWERIAIGVCITSFFPFFLSVVAFFWFTLGDPILGMQKAKQPSSTQQLPLTQACSSQHAQHHGRNNHPGLFPVLTCKNCMYFTHNTSPSKVERNEMVFIYLFPTAPFFSLF